MLRFRVYLDEAGCPQAEAAPPHELLAWFLEKDLGADVVRSRALLALVDQLLTGAATATAGDGARLRYELTADQARLIDPALDPPDIVELSLGAFRFALDQWIQLIAA